MTAGEVETRKANIQGFLSAEAVMEQQPMSTPPDHTNITLLKVNNYLPQKSNYSINNDSSLTAEFLQFQAVKLSCNVPVEHIYRQCMFAVQIKHQSLLLRKLYGLHRCQKVSFHISQKLQPLFRVSCHTFLLIFPTIANKKYIGIVSTVNEVMCSQPLICSSQHLLYHVFISTTWISKKKKSQLRNL